eukprot:5698414-Prymnesium_polylepis.1
MKSAVPRDLRGPAASCGPFWLAGRRDPHDLSAGACALHMSGILVDLQAKCLGHMHMYICMRMLCGV